jgi:hypothetical protein
VQQMTRGASASTVCDGAGRQVPVTDLRSGGADAAMLGNVRETTETKRPERSRSPSWCWSSENRRDEWRTAKRRGQAVRAGTS